jgi:curli biogenesis system outer membrane secretion channel CsgG
MVLPFDFAAPLSDEQRGELNSISELAAAMRGAPGAAPDRQNQSAINLGKATADLIVERLLGTGQFRLLERKAIEQIMAEQNLVAGGRAQAGQAVAQQAKLLGARYMVTGSITKFGQEKKSKGGALGGLVNRGPLGGGLGMSQTRYTVGITARVVETATGEVVASITSDGEVKGGRKLTAGGIGGSAGGLFGSSSTGDREKKIGEAVSLAVNNLVAQLVTARERGDLEP